MASLAVIGVGRTGGEVSYLAAALGIADELVLYDTNAALLRSQVLDLEHTGLPITVSTDKNRIRDADLCLFSAGLPRNPTVKTRADLLNTNLPATKECAGLLNNFSGILVTVTNPMDINNFYLCNKTGIPRERCIGFGGQLDSARFALSLKNRGIPGTGSVLGEHGEHQVPVFSTLPMAVPETCRDEILHELRGASMQVIRGKGGTVFGPAWHIAQLLRKILTDSRENCICSSVLNGEYGIDGCSLGVPVRIGKEGILGIDEWKLDTWEKNAMTEAGKFARALSQTVVR